MRTGRPVSPLTLSPPERETLAGWSRRRKTAQVLALRARVILLCARGLTNTAVASELRVTKQTVGKWRSRFLAYRLDGLLDEPRPGAPRRRFATLTQKQIRRGTHRSTRQLEAAIKSYVDTSN